MTRWCATTWQLIMKEWRLEWRSKELFTLLVCNAILLAVLVGAGVSSAVLDSSTTERVFPMLLWIVFVVSATTSVTRFNEQELEGRGFEGLLLRGVSGTQMYLAKAGIMSLFFFVSFMLLAGVLSIALDQDLSLVVMPLTWIGLGASCALALLLALLAAVASTSKLKGVLLPIISLPILFPVFLSGLEMTTQVVLRGGLEEGAPWGGILLCAATMYGVAGALLFEVAIRD